MRIPDSQLDCTVFLYPDQASAEAGEHMGGSGFLVERPCERLSGYSTYWVVTNRHVIEGGAWTLRINTQDGGFTTVDTTEVDWFFHPDGDDLAVCFFKHRPNYYNISTLPVSWLITEDDLSVYDVGPGDGTYVIGRFVNHAGRQRNNPTVRFGQIAQMPFEKIRCDGRDQLSFLVEIRSLGGYSGSPVFLYFDRNYYRAGATGRTDSKGKKIFVGVFESGGWVLGVDWCMLPSWEPVCDSKGQEIPSGWMVPANTGMMGVVPAWRLRWLLTEHPPILSFVGDIEDREMSKRNEKPPTALPTSSTGDQYSSDEAHLRFNAALRGARKAQPLQMKDIPRTRPPRSEGEG